MRLFRPALVVLLALSISAPCYAEKSPAGANRPDEDSDSDNLVNSEEAKLDTDPDNLDTDGDGWPDGWEVVPLNPQITVLAAQETRYALIDIGEAYRVCGIHDNGDILFASLGTTPGTEIGKIWRQGTLTTIGEGKQGSFLGPTSDGSVYFTESTTTTEQFSDIYGNRTTTTRGMRRYHPTEASPTEPYGLAEEDRTWTGTLPFPFPSTPPPTASLGGFHSGQWSDVWQYITGNMTEQLSGYSIVANPPNFGSYQTVKTKLGRMNQAGDQAVEMTYLLKANFERQTGNQTQTANLDLAMGMGGWRGNPDLYSAGSWRVSTEAALQDLLTKEVVVGLYKYATAKVGTGIVQFDPTQNTPDTPLDGVTFVSEINDGVPYHWPFFLAATSNGTRLVLDNAGELEMVPAPPPASSTGIIGQSLSANLVIPTGSGIWRNSKSLSASELLTSYYWSKPSIQFVSPITHLLAGTATRKKSDNGNDIPIENQERRAVLMIPCEIAVDANRDGTIKFAGNFYNLNNAGKSPDKTSESRPFRFWLNDDDDGTGNGAEIIDGPADSADDMIKSCRDLEDFTRLHLYVGGLQDAIVAGTISVGLEWRNPTDFPAIKIYHSAELDGGDRYLKTELGAGQQTIGSPATSIGTVSRGGSFKFPASFWQANPLTGLTALSTSNANRYLLFEGVTEGKGQLVFTFWKGNEKIGEGPGAWIELKDVRKMYMRSYGKPRAGSVPWQRPSEYNPYQEPVVTNAPMDAIVFEQPLGETSDTIVLVHGIHGPGVFTEEQALKGYTQMGSTTFKRLWHQGFRGRFGFYKWEAHHITQFNESEYRAWKSGRGLAAFLVSLPGENKNLICFSQGGIVGSSSIRDYGAKPNAMIVMQAAVPAVCYDDDPTLNRFPNAMPDTVDDLGYRGYHGTTGTRFINFSDPTDDSTGDLWAFSQNIKPEPRYGYDPTATVGQRHTVTYAIAVGRFVTDLHESLPMIARSKSRTIPHEPGASGVISSSIPLDSTFGFDNEHGAAFDRPIQRNLNDFYDEVLSQFGIPFNP